jgi:hypothetical protein
LAIWFCEVDPTVTDPCLEPNDGLDFAVIGSDQGLGEPKETRKKLLFEPGARYDIVIDFTGYEEKCIIMANGGGDSLYGGGGTPLPISSDFDLTDRIMAFDVSATRVTNSTVPKYEDFDFYPDPLLNNPDPNRVRLVGLWEGLDEVSFMKSRNIPSLPCFYSQYSMSFITVWTSAASSRNCQ